MTVTGSGAITFSNIMNEFNPSGGQSNIKFSDYLARNPDNPTGGGTYAPTGQGEVVYISWSGTQFLFNSVASTFNPAYFARDKDAVITFALDNTVNVPVYISSSINTTGSDLISNVVNNGGQYSAGGTYQLGAYTFIYLNQKLVTATGGNTTNGAPFATNAAIYINTNTQQTNGGNNVALAIAACDNPTRHVTKNRPFFDISFSSSFVGGQENGKAPGTYTHNGLALDPGMIKNGDTLTINMPCSSLQNANTSGTIVYAYSPYFVPVTWNDNSNKTLARGFTTGSTGYLFWNTYPGSGTNFVNGANVEAVATNGAIVQADTVTFNSATSISAAFTIATDGTYFLRIENPDGNAVRSSSALLTVSDAPAWTTSAGSLGSNASNTSVSYTVAATGATSFSKTAGTFPGGVSLNTSTGVISGTESGATAETTYNFTIRATDAEGQTADRAFSITITVGINNSGGFN